MNPIDKLGGAAALAPLADDGAAPVAAADPSCVAKATKAAVQFEGFFISHMLHQMRAGTRAMAGEDSVFKDPVNSDMLDLADTMVAEKMAGQRAFGIADAILRQLLPPAPAPKPVAAAATAAENLPPPLNGPA